MKSFGLLALCLFIYHASDTNSYGKVSALSEYGKDLTGVDIYLRGKLLHDLDQLTFMNEELECRAHVTPTPGLSKPLLLSNVTYQWTNGSVILSTNSKYTITVLDSKNRTFSCTAALGSENYTAKFEIPAGGPIDPAGILGDTDYPEYSQGADYQLVCFILQWPRNKGVTYQFFKDGTPLGNVATRTFYMIMNANYTDSGTYWCNATYQGVTSKKSYHTVVNIGAPGQYCTNATADRLCKGDTYSGCCKANRCDCRTNFVPKGEECIQGKNNASPAVAASFLYAVVVVILLCRWT